MDWQSILGSQLPDDAELLTRKHVWLMHAPASVHPGLWRVVCLAAVEAMDKGRRLLGGWHQREAAGGDPAPPPIAAGRRAMAHFWALLEDFAAGPWPVRVGHGDDMKVHSLPSDHPFFRLNDAGDLVVHRREVGYDLWYFG